MPDRPMSQGWVPVPDPTKLTTDAVASAKEDIEKLFDVKLNGFRELVTEKFAGRDTALAAALKAAQELVKQQNDSNTIAIDKAAAAFTKQVDSLDEKINDIKDRIGAVENYAKGGAAMWGAVIGGIGLLIAASTLVILFVKTSSG